MQQNISVEFTPEDLGRTFLLGIGIDHYESSRIEPLANAVRSTTSFINLLLERYQLEESNLITLFDRQAMRSNILENLQRLAKTLTPEDDLLIFYAGQSAYNKELDISYWMPHDMKMDDLSSGISHEELIRFISADPIVGICS